MDNDDAPDAAPRDDGLSPRAFEEVCELVDSLERRMTSKTNVVHLEGESLRIRLGSLTKRFDDFRFSVNESLVNQAAGNEFYQEVIFFLWSYANLLKEFAYGDSVKDELREGVALVSARFITTAVDKEWGESWKEFAQMMGLVCPDAPPRDVDG